MCTAIAHGDFHPQSHELAAFASSPPSLVPGDGGGHGGRCGVRGQETSARGNRLPHVLPSMSTVAATRPQHRLRVTDHEKGRATAAENAARFLGHGERQTCCGREGGRVGGGKNYPPRGS